MTKIRPSKALALIAAVLLVMVLWALPASARTHDTSSNSSASAAPASAKAPASDSQAPGYVGSEVCETCHVDMEMKFLSIWGR